MELSSTVRPGASVPMPPRCGAAPVRRGGAPPAVLAKGVDIIINQVGVRRGHHNQIPYSAADGQRLQPPRDRHRAAREHGRPICMRHGMAAHEVAEGQGAGRPSNTVRISLLHALLYWPYCIRGACLWCSQ